MGFRDDFFGGGCVELEEDKIYFQHFIDGKLVYVSVDDKQAKIEIKSAGKNSCLLFLTYKNEMPVSKLKDKLEEYYGTRDLMILKENMQDFISRIRREENGKD